MNAANNGRIAIPVEDSFYYNVLVFSGGNLCVPLKCVTAAASGPERPDQIRSGVPALNWATVVDSCGFIGTTSVYGQTHDLAVRESAAWRTAFQPGLGQPADYALNKWWMECEPARTSSVRGGDYTIVRRAILYGRSNHTPRESCFVDLIEQNRMIFIPEENLPLFNFVWVDDLRW